MTKLAIREVPIEIRATLRDSTSRGQLRVEQRDKKERSAQAARAWMLCWLAAFGAIFIPLLHFILVPLLLLAGPVAAFFIAAQEQVILGGEGPCPECQRQVTFPKQSWKSPISDLCPHCQNPLALHAESTGEPV